MKCRNRRQWKKLLSRVNDSKSFTQFCDRYFGRTTWGNNPDDRDVEYAALWHGGNILFCVGHNAETGEISKISRVAPQKEWGRQK